MTGHAAAVLRPSASESLPVREQQITPQAHPSVRLLTGFAGFGAGSVNLAISSSLFAAAPGAGEPDRLAGAVVAGLWGLSLLAAAVLFLARDRPTGGRWTRYALAAAAVAHLAAIAFPASSTPGLRLTQLSALLLTLMIIAMLGWLGRAQGRQDSRRPESAGDKAGMRPGRLLLSAFAGAVLVAGITTPGLAASTPGRYAVPHGGHGSVDHGNPDHENPDQGNPDHGNLAPGGHHQR